MQFYFYMLLKEKATHKCVAQSVDKSTLFYFLGKINLGDDKYVN